LTPDTPFDDDLRRWLSEGASAMRIDLSEAQVSAFLRYAGLLVEWNARMNLTRLISARDIAVEHFLDSLSVLNAVPIGPGATLLDVGAGAGFPSMPLRIARPDLKVTLLEATNKKLTFVGAVAEALDLAGVTLVHGRAESPPAQIAGKQYEVVTARAVAPMRELATWTYPFLRPRTGVLAALKGPQADDECVDARPTFARLKLSTQIVTVQVAGSDKDHRIVVCTQKRQ
jgi:16S rRNA (guanine527-N7)-methyltransferase